MKKSFDCVEMKRRGAERVYEQTKNMTVAEEVEFWRRKSEALRREQERLQRRDQDEAPGK